VEPGDQLVLQVRVLRTKRSIWRFSGEALVDGEVAASAELMCAEQPVQP
jgi:3-hydroxyacyl-[acyl-carrier-protein] dehydratase